MCICYKDEQIYFVLLEVEKKGKKQKKGRTNQYSYLIGHNLLL